jgi:hypothetical protein
MFEQFLLNTNEILQCATESHSNSARANNAQNGQRHRTGTPHAKTYYLQCPMQDSREAFLDALLGIGDGLAGRYDNLPAGAQPRILRGPARDTWQMAPCSRHMHPEVASACNTRPL